ncbi:MAG: MGMT family protein [Candidatus Helarchaeota archaeon]
MKKRNQITDFERQVFEIVRKIPSGRVATYGLIAEILGKNCARAVGNAMAKNPFSFLSNSSKPVPCHRVVRSDGSVGGFMGDKMKNRSIKIDLLKKEGIRIKKNGTIDLSEYLVDPQIIRKKIMDGLQ